MSNAAATFTAPAYFGRTLELPECAEILSRMSLESVVGRLVLLKHINDRVYADSDRPASSLAHYTERTIEYLFDINRQEYARKEASSDNKFRPISDQALLATLELAKLCSPRDRTHWIEGDPLRLELTHVLLSFQDVLYSRTFQARLSVCQSFEELGPNSWHEFLRNSMAHNTGRYYRRAFGRLFALCKDPEINELLRERTQGRSVCDWFINAFDLTPDEYLGCSFLAAAPAWGLDFTQPDASSCFYRPSTYWNLIDEPYQEKIHRLIDLASRAAGDCGPLPNVAIDNFLYDACIAHVHPVLDLGDVAISIGPHLLTNKFVVGLPYLAQEMATRRVGRRLTTGEVAAARAPFGILFECYVLWLLRRFLTDWTSAELNAPVWCGPAKEHGECDMVIVRRDTAYVFEVKTTLATLAFRKTGSFVGLDSILKEGAEQAYRAARALRAGVAVRASNGLQIEGIRFVVPCVVTYEDNPLYFPISDFYERHLEDVTSLPLFTPNDGIEPVQFFDVDFLESWEMQFDLSPNSGAPFGYLLQRARDPRLRHRGIQNGVVQGRRENGPTPFDDTINQSRAFLDELVRSWNRPPNLSK